MKWARLKWLVVLGAVTLPALGLYIGQILYERDLTRASARVGRLLAVYKMLDRYEVDHGGPPDNAAALDSYRVVYADAVEAVEHGEIIVVWGRSVSVTRPEPVAVAHERIDGRTRVRVLWSDGSVSGRDATDVPRLARR